MEKCEKNEKLYKTTDIISLNMLITNTCHKIFNNLSLLSDLLVKKTNHERKMELLKFTKESRILLCRLTAVIRWISNNEKVMKCFKTNHFINTQMMNIHSTYQTMIHFGNLIMPSSQQPSYPINVALQVLLTGNYKLPSSIMGLKEPDIKRDQNLIKKLNNIIKFKLVMYGMPHRFKNYNIRNGILKIRVENQYILYLTLLGEFHTKWVLVNLEVLLKDDVDNCKLIHEFQMSYLKKFLQHHLNLDCEPLNKIDKIMHFFSVGLNLDILYTKIEKGVKLKLYDYIKIEQYIVGKMLSITYWKNRRANQTFKICLEFDPLSKKCPLKLTHFPNIDIENSLVSCSKMCNQRFSFDKLFSVTIHTRSVMLLVELEAHIRKQTCLKTLIVGNPALLKIYLIDSKLDHEILVLRINTFTGRFMVMLGFKKTPETINFENNLNADVSDLIKKDLMAVRNCIGLQRIKDSFLCSGISVALSLYIKGQTCNIQSKPHIFIRFPNYWSYYFVISLVNDKTLTEPFIFCYHFIYAVHCNEISIENNKKYSPSSSILIKYLKRVHVNNCENMGLQFDIKELNVVNFEEILVKIKKTEFYKNSVIAYRDNTDKCFYATEVIQVFTCLSSKIDFVEIKASMNTINLQMNVLLTEQLTNSHALSLNVEHLSTVIPCNIYKFILSIKIYKKKLFEFSIFNIKTVLSYYPIKYDNPNCILKNFPVLSYDRSHNFRPISLYFQIFWCQICSIYSNVEYLLKEIHKYNDFIFLQYFDFVTATFHYGLHYDYSLSLKYGKQGLVVYLSNNKNYKNPQAGLASEFTKLFEVDNVKNLFNIVCKVYETYHFYTALNPFGSKIFYYDLESFKNVAVCVQFIHITPILYNKIVLRFKDCFLLEITYSNNNVELKDMYSYQDKLLPILNFTEFFKINFHIYNEYLKNKSFNFNETTYRFDVTKRNQFATSPIIISLDFFRFIMNVSRDRYIPCCHLVDPFSCSFSIFYMFLGSTVMANNIIEVANLPNFKNDRMFDQDNLLIKFRECQCQFYYDYALSQLAVQFTNTPGYEYIKNEDTDVVDNYFRTRIAIYPFVKTTIFAFYTVLGYPIHIVLQFIDLMRMEMYNHTRNKRSMKLVFTNPPPRTLLGKMGECTLQVVNECLLFLVKFVETPHTSKSCEAGKINYIVFNYNPKMGTLKANESNTSGLLNQAEKKFIWDLNMVQEFFKQQFIKETTTQLEFYRKTRLKQAVIDNEKPFNAIPPDPSEFALKVKLQEDLDKKNIQKECQIKFTNVEKAMKDVDSDTKSRLYDGISQDYKGRYDYLNRRNQINPKEKYNYPILSSWHYGWNLDEVSNDKKSQHSSINIIQQTFYTRNGIL
ncbi:hypothetical protein A3Q56_07030 [Intoshia linei]|uniref:Mediator of RNA polymerase II transcription subunit 14 n=1 Tax=Intoshia linei TaxID=1819745 RepID=A0A177ATV6_9BILA|nr:hypothetical protein A3Q56_07030 [Intoshia linei]